MIQGCRKQVERKELKEGYELQLVMAMVMGCQWNRATLDSFLQHGLAPFYNFTCLSNLKFW